MNTDSPTVFATQPLPVWRRAVLKVGSNLLTAGEQELSAQHARASG